MDLIKDDTKKVLIATVDMLICTRGRVFVGTDKSTFTGYIQRLRGYMPDVPVKDHLLVTQHFPRDYETTWTHSPDAWCVYCKEYADGYLGI